MSRTLKLLGAGALTISGLAVLGIAGWEAQKNFHAYLWNLYPIDSTTAQVNCLGVALLGLHVWEAEEWRCSQIESLRQSGQFSILLDDPTCELMDDYRIRCSEPNDFLTSVIEGEQ